MSMTLTEHVQEVLDTKAWRQIWEERAGTWCYPSHRGEDYRISASNGQVRGCSCPARGTCRHMVALAIALEVQAWAEEGLTYEVNAVPVELLARIIALYLPAPKRTTPERNAA